jgi:hypothetical protein
MEEVEGRLQRGGRWKRCYKGWEMEGSVQQMEELEGRLQRMEDGSDIITKIGRKVTTLMEGGKEGYNGWKNWEEGYLGGKWKGNTTNER